MQFCTTRQLPFFHPGTVCPRSRCRSCLFFSYNSTFIDALRFGMNVEYHDSLVLIQRNYIVETYHVTMCYPIMASIHQLIERTRLNMSIFIIPMEHVWVVQEPYSAHPTTSHVMSAHLVNIPTHPHLLCSHTASAH